MFDARRGLSCGDTLAFGENDCYTVVKEIGRGASCIVYEADYRDQQGITHHARVKECYPCEKGVQRNVNGELCAKPMYEEMFAREKEKFFEAYRRNVALNGAQGLVNSTMDAINLFAANNTWYSVMACVEGQDYSHILDENLYSLFIRLFSLTKIIKRYHDYGVLHLDIKPENIFIIPETKEHMILFDFDSLRTREELCGDSETELLFSEGYAAPELVRGYKGMLCEATDLYSIGAVAFYKIFGRTPEIEEIMERAEIDFSDTRYEDPRYCPEFHRQVCSFFGRTIALKIQERYKNAEELLPELKKLIDLSDLGKPFLQQTFSYHQGFFAGRRKELEKIAQVFEKGQQALFLSGVGGIGKTQLAQRYAYENGERYRTIAFVRFEDSIPVTVCGVGLLINGMERGEEETDEAYFKRKLEALKKVVTMDDLIIFDNFDWGPEEKPDECLELFLECPCRFLITTREDCRDYGYEQIQIKPMENREDLLQLFRFYNDVEYDEKEMKDIEEIVELVDRHTMTVDLLAKYLRMTEDSPGILLKKLLEKEGIVNADEAKVLHRKDIRLSQTSIDGHMLALFQLSDFTEVEKELLRSLSLLGYVRIRKDNFLEYCGIAGCEEQLDRLIRQGWVEEDELSDKISLHTVILDLVYNHLNPTSENCPHIVDAMAEELQRNLETYTEKQVRKRLLDSFMKRAKGADLRYANLCLLYCWHTDNRKDLLNALDAAESICLSALDPVRYDLMQNINRIRIRKEFCFEKKYDLFETDLEAYLDEQSKRIWELAQNAWDYAKKYSDDPAYLGKFCVRLARDLDEVVGEEMEILLPFGKRSLAADRLFDLAVLLLDAAMEYVQASNLDNEEKKLLFRNMQEFFDCSDFTCMYRNEYYADEEKAALLQGRIERVRDSDTICFDFMEGYESIAEVAEENGEYGRAIELYYKACETESIPYWFALQKIANLYAKKGELERAVGILKEALERERDPDGYLDSICCDLIDLLMAEKRQAEAKQYAEELISHNADRADEGEDAAVWMIAAYFRLYKMEEETEEKESHWKNCLHYFTVLKRQESEAPEEIYEFLFAYVERQETKEGQIKSAFQILERFEKWYSKKLTAHLMDYVIPISQGESDLVKYYILAQLRYSEYMMEEDTGQAAKALGRCEEARKAYEFGGLADKYLDHLIYKTAGECHHYLDEYDYDRILAERRKCDYYYLAQQDAQGKPPKKQRELWEQAAYDYQFTENFAMEAKCYERLLEIKCNAWEEYWRFSLAQMRCYVKLKAQEKLKARAFQICGEAVVHSDEICRKFQECGDILLEGRLEKEAFALYVSAIIAVSANLEGESLKNTVLKGGECPEALFWEFSRALHSELASENLDMVVELSQRLEPMFGENGSFSAFEKEIKWFSETYQYANIEFKR